jgi:hypothetical protein
MRAVLVMLGEGHAKHKAKNQGRHYQARHYGEADHDNEFDHRDKLLRS